MTEKETESETDTEYDLPDRGFEWGDPESHPEVDGVTWVTNAERFSPDVKGVYLTEHAVAFVPEGGDRLVDEKNGVEVPIPRYYSRFDDEFETYVARVTAGSRSYGFGIDARQLEDGVRVATGGGRFSRDDVTVVALDKSGFLVRVPDGDFLVSYTDVPKPEGYEPRDSAVYTIAGMHVPEESETIREGIDTLAAVLRRHFDVEIVEHEKLYSGNHHFRTDGDGTFRLSGYHLRTLARMTTDQASLVGEHEYTDPWGETFRFSVSEDDVEYEIGDPAYAHGSDNGAVIVGYSLNWDDPRRSSRASLSGKVSLDIQYAYMSPHKDNRSVKVRTKNRSVGGIRPENKSYDPIDDSM